MEADLDKDLGSDGAINLLGDNLSRTCIRTRQELDSMSYDDRRDTMITEVAQRDPRYKVDALHKLNDFQIMRAFFYQEICWPKNGK